MITVTDGSAWRRWAFLPTPRRIGDDDVPGDWGRPTNEELQAVDLHSYRLSVSPVRPLDILTCSPKARLYTKTVCSHSFSAPLPAGSICRLGSDVCIVSPELLFLRMAPKLSFAQRIALGMELCGRYGVIPGDETGFVKRPPVTSVKKIEAYLGRCHGLYGVGPAREALPWVLDNSRSPMESVLAILLTIGRRRGGCHLPLPKLNYTVRPEGDQRRLVRQDHFDIDLAWPERMLAVEYNSDDYHEGDDKRRSDAGRDNGLEALGWTVVSVTSDQVMDDGKLTVLSRQIASLLNWHDLTMSDAFVKRRAALRGELMRMSW